jgi:hypothetical protein
MERKYLRITIHDNDFRYSLGLIGDLLYSVFCSEDSYPTEEELPALREHIKRLWHSTYSVKTLMCNTLMKRLFPDYIDENVNYVDEGYFNPHLELVDYADIPDWDNYESIYIPMFGNGEILMR